MRSVRLIHAVAEAAILGCAYALGAIDTRGGGGRDNRMRFCTRCSRIREIGARRERWNTRCSWVENTRLGAALSSTFRDGPAAGLGGCTRTSESRSLG